MPRSGVPDYWGHDPCAAMRRQGRTDDVLFSYVVQVSAYFYGMLPSRFIQPQRHHLLACVPLWAFDVWYTVRGQCGVFLAVYC